MLLAFNLLLRRVCVLGSSTLFSEFEVVPNIPESLSQLEKKGSRYEVHSADSMTISDRSFVEVGIKDMIEEAPVVSLFNRLQRAARFDVLQTSSIQETNLSRSLSEYEEAMASLEAL